MKESCNLGSAQPFKAQAMKDDTSMFEQMKGRVFSYLMRRCGDWDLSRDILQETFARYLERYAGKDVPPSLLFTIARNAFIDHARKHRRSAPLEGDPEDGAPDAHHHLLVREEYGRVLDAMALLSDDEREVLSLALSSDLSYAQIAGVTGLSEGNVKVKVHRARCRIKEILQGGDHER
ncbi:MAG TPA: RNA polymerase sigma factor [Deltaproteobacteria bacterium]|nr:RNA polymerase sigma factor [Deltaproteobacteria bacterium]HQI82126.1 RNA polymerase sigma factor [Deltaproteobacteria bacterium]